MGHSTSKSEAERTNPFSKAEGSTDGAAATVQKERQRAGAEAGRLIGLVVGKVRKFFSACFCIFSDSSSKIIRSERKEKKVPEKRRKGIKWPLWKAGQCIDQGTLHC